MKYLKEFNSSSDYEDFVEEENIDKPSVYYLVNEKEVIYNQEKKIFIDLGLPSGNLWATEPIKNDNNEVLYFAWGETTGYSTSELGTEKNFTLNDYDLSNGSDYTKYNNTDSNNILLNEDDAATQTYGDGFCTPSPDDWLELINNTTISLEYLDDGNASYPVYIFTSDINGKKLELKCYGYCTNGELDDFEPYYYMGLIAMTDELYDLESCFALQVQHNYNNYNVEGGDGLRIYTYYDNFYKRHYGFPIFAIKRGAINPPEQEAPINEK